MRIINPKVITRSSRSIRKTVSNGSILPAMPPKELFTGSLQGLADRIANTTANPANIASILSSDPDNRITGGKTMQQAIALLLNGCNDTLQKYLKAKKQAIPQPEEPQQQYIADTEGLFFDVATYLTGQPECWINTFAEELPNKILNVYVNVSASHKVREKQFFDKLIGVVNHIDKLEATNTRCNVFVTIGGVAAEQGITGGSITVQIKKSSEPVNLQQLSTLLATPIMLRFAFFVLSAEINGSSYGVMYTDNNEMDEAHKLNGLYIPSMYYDGYNGISSYNKPLNEIYNHINGITVHEYDKP